MSPGERDNVAFFPQEVQLKLEEEGAGELCVKSRVGPGSDAGSCPRSQRPCRCIVLWDTSLSAGGIGGSTVILQLEANVNSLSHHECSTRKQRPSTSRRRHPPCAFQLDIARLFTPRARHQSGCPQFVPCHQRGLAAAEPSSGSAKVPLISRVGRRMWLVQIQRCRRHGESGHQCGGPQYFACSADSRHELDYLGWSSNQQPLLERKAKVPKIALPLAKHRQAWRGVEPCK